VGREGRQKRKVDQPRLSYRIPGLLKRRNVVKARRDTHNGGKKKTHQQIHSHTKNLADPGPGGVLNEVSEDWGIGPKQERGPRGGSCLEIKDGRKQKGRLNPKNPAHRPVV